MPIYEYRCDSCGQHLEVLQKISEEPLSDCPNCGQSGLRKLVSAAAFRLKGGGWYATDFKDGGKKKPEEGGKETPAQANPVADAKADAKDKAPGGGSERATAVESKS